MTTEDAWRLVGLIRYLRGLGELDALAHDVLDLIDAILADHTGDNGPRHLDLAAFRIPSDTPERDA